MECRACRQQEETQKHILEECPIIHPHNKGTEVHTQDLNSGNMNELRKTVRKINNIMMNLHTYNEENIPTQTQQPSRTSTTTNQRTTPDELTQIMVQRPGDLGTIVRGADTAV